MTEVRDSVVELLVRGCAGELSADEYSEIIATATVEEKKATTRALARAALLAVPAPPAPSLLELTYPELVRKGAELYASGYALAWLANELAGQWPDWCKLGDVLKVAPAWRVEHMRAELARCGVTLDDGDQDDVL
jgi:hypothetical protein